jgi:hypothetical protein
VYIAGFKEGRGDESPTKNRLCCCWGETTARGTGCHAGRAGPPNMPNQSAACTEFEIAANRADESQIWFLKPLSFLKRNHSRGRGLPCLLDGFAKRGVVGLPFLRARSSEFQTRDLLRSGGAPGAAAASEQMGLVDKVCLASQQTAVSWSS